MAFFLGASPKAAPELTHLFTNWFENTHHFSVVMQDMICTGGRFRELFCHRGSPTQLFDSFENHGIIGSSDPYPCRIACLGVGDRSLLPMKWI
jgi:hypothetical protein